MPLVIRPARTADAPALSELASRIFYETFASSTAPHDMEAFLAKAYNEPRMRVEIEDSSIVTLVVDDDGVLAGYAQLRFGQPPACITGPDPVEVWRFYIDKAHHGRGVAQQLMSTIDAVARQRQARTMWLGVWEHNDRARAFYAKYGFRHVGEHTFVVGADEQTDLLLERALQ